MIQILRKEPLRTENRIGGMGSAMNSTGDGKGTITEVRQNKSTTLSKKQQKAFKNAADEIMGRDSRYTTTVYLHFAMKLICVVLAVVILRIFVFEPNYVDGESMQPTLMDRERVFVEKVSYWFNEPKRGDIVIVHFPERSELFVKRIIALGGETIAIRNGFVYINDKQLDESEYAGDWYGNIYRTVHTLGSVDGSYTVPYGCVFVMGDNRNESHDSRAQDVGPIPIEDVVGRAVSVIWPLNRIRPAK